MSHFAILVITEQKPDEELIGEILQPFHEFECTGTDDGYVQSINKTEEARAEFAKQKERRMKGPDGVLYKTYDKIFYRDPTAEDEAKVGHKMIGSGGGAGVDWASQDWGDGQGYCTKVKFKPEGFEEVELAANELQTFAEWAQDWHGGEIVQEHEVVTPRLNDKVKYGWIRVNAAGDVIEIIDRTNPNKKWDWWQLGGRWTGFLVPKPGVSVDGDDAPEMGEPSMLASKEDLANRPHGFDVIRKCDVDMEAMRSVAADEAAVRWDKIYAVVGNLDDFIPWAKVVEMNQAAEGAWRAEGVDAARTFYHAQRAKKLLTEAGNNDFFWTDLEDYMFSRDEYIQRNRDGAMSLFAFVKDGQWVERGQMGWFGFAANKQDKAEWSRKYNEMLDALPDDTWLSVVDCHI